jgi:hypothetical protein
MISPESKMRSSDRVLKLEIMEGKKAMSSTGIIDPRLFKDGEDGNQLHAVMDPETCMWSFKYEKGAVPPALKGVFTGFKALKKHAENYFEGRNIKITEVKD